MPDTEITSFAIGVMIGGCGALALSALWELARDSFRGMKRLLLRLGVLKPDDFTNAYLVARAADAAWLALGAGAPPAGEAGRERFDRLVREGVRAGMNFYLAEYRRLYGLSGLRHVDRRDGGGGGGDGAGGA